MRKLRVAFVCVHNSCRSQIAEALGRYLAFDVFESYSAGTDINKESKSKINQDAVRLMKEMYDLDMEKKQYAKQLKDIPIADIVITMGCNVQCPNIACQYREDWGLADPTGKNDEAFQLIISKIHDSILELKDRIVDGLLALEIEDEN